VSDLLKPAKMGEAPPHVLAGQLNYAGAWDRVLGKAGMAGVDGVSVRRFERSAAVFLRGLQSRLAGERYLPLPLRMAELEKKTGGALRLLLVPTIADRVAQSAVAAWLGSHWNSSFDASSFAYRPGFGVHDALRRVAELRNQGFRWVLDADIRSFFDSIPHSLLLDKLERWLGAGSPMLGWLRSWLAAAVWDGEQLSRVTCGVPQGSPLSPILANFYLHEFDIRLRTARIHLVRYADDFLVLARTPFELDEHRKAVEQVLADLRLSLSAEKTRTTTFEQYFRFLGAEIQGDNILLPFEKMKTPKVPFYVAPVMPPALLRAYRLGHLKVSGPLQWTGIRRERAKVPVGAPAKPQRPALGVLSGSPSMASLSSLRRIP
jgi:group II intron reverse transcriptase/maturase